MNGNKLLWHGIHIMAIGGLLGIITAVAIMFTVLASTGAQPVLNIAGIVTTIGLVMMGISIPFCKTNPLWDRVGDGDNDQIKK